MFTVKVKARSESQVITKPVLQQYIDKHHHLFLVEQLELLLLSSSEDAVPCHSCNHVAIQHLPPHQARISQIDVQQFQISF